MTKFIQCNTQYDVTFLLSLLPPSCMVAPIRDQGNITHSATTMSFNSLKLTPGQDINMDTNPIEAMFDLGNNLEVVRGCSLDMSIHRPRSPSLLSSKCEEEYNI